MAPARLARTDAAADIALAPTPRDNATTAPLRRDEVYDPISDITISVWSGCGGSKQARRGLCPSTPPEAEPLDTIRLRGVAF